MLFDGLEFKKAWMLFAPIWVHDPEGHCCVIPRYGFFGEVLLGLAEGVCQIRNLIMPIIDREYVPHFPITIWEE
jgi:hypothetical protein